MKLKKYMMSSFRYDGEDYIEYARLHETVSLTCASNTMRKLALDAYNVVSEACTMGTANRDEKNSPGKS